MGDDAARRKYRSDHGGRRQGCEDAHGFFRHRFSWHNAFLAERFPGRSTLSASSPKKRSPGRARRSNRYFRHHCRGSKTPSGGTPACTKRWTSSFSQPASTWPRRISVLAKVSGNLGQIVEQTCVTFDLGGRNDQALHNRHRRECPDRPVSRGSTSSERKLKKNSIGWPVRERNLMQTACGPMRSVPFSYSESAWVRHAESSRRASLLDSSWRGSRRARRTRCPDETGRYL